MNETADVVKNQNSGTDVAENKGQEINPIEMVSPEKKFDRIELALSNVFNAVKSINDLKSDESRRSHNYEVWRTKYSKLIDLIALFEFQLAGYQAAFSDAKPCIESYDISYDVLSKSIKKELVNFAHMMVQEDKLGLYNSKFPNVYIDAIDKIGTTYHETLSPIS